MGTQTAYVVCITQNGTTYRSAPIATAEEASEAAALCAPSWIERVRVITSRRWRR